MQPVPPDKTARVMIGTLLAGLHPRKMIGLEATKETCLSCAPCLSCALRCAALPATLQAPAFAQKGGQRREKTRVASQARCAQMDTHFLLHPFLPHKVLCFNLSMEMQEIVQITRCGCYSVLASSALADQDIPQQLFHTTALDSQGTTPNTASD